MSKAQTARLTTAAVLLLVLLRIGIGWHCAYDGYARIRGPGAYTVVGRIQGAEGPAREPFRWLAEPGQELVLGVLNSLMSWGMLGLGVFFMLGFLTRTTGTILLVLLLFFYLAGLSSGVTGTALDEGGFRYVNKSLIEMLAILVVMATGISRRSGLDRLLRRQVVGTSADRAIIQGEPT